MEKNYLSTVENNAHNENFKNYIWNIKLVREYLEEKYNTPFNFTGINNNEWQMFMDDYRDKSSDLVFLTKVSEDLLDKQIVWYGEKEKRIDESPSNSVFYYPKYELAVASVYHFMNNGMKNNDYIFFSDKEKYIEFTEEANRRATHLEEKEIIIFTDSPNGPNYERQAVNQLIDRSQVVLEEKLKNDIYASIDQFFKENDEFYKKYNIQHKRGILLYGEPGNGKTTLVKSLVGTLEAPVIYWQVNEFTNSQSVKQVFDTVSNLSPAVLVIEDLDSLPPSTRSTFLNTLDGATTKEGTFLIGTTNYPERIDKALINRVGRFDRTYEIKLPNETLRFEYLNIRGTGDFLSQEELRDVAKQTEGFSFVQLSEVFRQLAYANYHGEAIDINDVIVALKDNNRKSQKNTWNSKDDKVLGFMD